MNIQTDTPTSNDQSQGPVIDQVLRLFEAADPAILGLLAEDIDFRIDHYKDEADTSWQQANGVSELGGLLARLGTEVFPKGTRILDLSTTPLGNGWAMTCFEQEFFYGVRDGMVRSLTYIISHEEAGKLDFFRETVTTITTL